MKKTLIITAVIMAAGLMAGCGQELNLTVYNDTGVTPLALAYCEGRVEWDAGAQSKAFSGTGSTPAANNSFTVQLKEGSDVVVYGYGNYYEADCCGNTTLKSFSNVDSVSIYGGYLEAPNWYACIYLDKVLIYKK